MESVNTRAAQAEQMRRWVMKTILPWLVASVAGSERKVVLGATLCPEQRSYHGWGGPQSPPQDQRSLWPSKLQPIPVRSLSSRQVSLSLWQW